MFGLGYILIKYKHLQIFIFNNVFNNYLNGKKEIMKL